MSVKSPEYSEDHPSRDIQCQQALELSVKEIISSAVAAGWNANESGQAIADLAIDFLEAEGDRARLLSIIHHAESSR